MDIFESTLKNINFPIIIWKKNTKNKFVCYFTNDKIEDVKKDMYLKKYLHTKDLHIKESYDEIITKRTNSIIKHDNVYINKTYIDENSFFEIHTPAENMNLFATISHKIRSPLTNIMGIMTLIDTKSMSEENRKYLNIIKESSYAITNVVNDVIDILNFHQNNMKVQHDHININNMVKKCVQITSQQKKNIKVVTNIGKDVPEVIITDNTKLMQIIINLLSNSFKFTDQGDIIITVSLGNKKKISDEQYDILFTIKDTGCGMTPQQKMHVENTLNATTLCYDNYVGGFGLIICANLCKVLGCKIWFKTEIDIGTIFYVNIKCDGLKIL